MADPINIQQLKDASEDAISLAEFINKPENVMIPRRLASDIHSLQYYLEYMKSFAQRSYESYDEMVANASNLSDNVSVFVTNDLDSSKNGIYTYNGTSFVKGEYQPENAAKEFVEAKLDSLPFEGGILADTFVVVDGDQTQRQLNAKTERTYSSVSAMLSDSALKAGEFAKTRGFYSVDDAGGANYKVITKGEANAANIIYGDVSSVSDNYAFLLASGFVAVITEQEEYCLEQFGAIGDGVYDCHPTFLLALSIYQSGTGMYSTSPSIRLNKGSNYYCSKVINLKKSVKIHSDGSGMPHSSNAEVTFAAGQSGFIINRHNTLENTVVKSGTAADSTTLEGFTIRSSLGTADASGGHGIWMRGRATVKKMLIRDFQGNGLHIYAGSDGGADHQGNANNFLIEQVRVSGCLNGMYTRGIDANAGNTIGLDCSGNRRWGILEHSFLGNQYYGCHVASNGHNSGGYVEYEGAWYQACVLASEEDLVNTVPSTNENVWLSGIARHYYAKPWIAGQPVGTYVSAGGYAAIGANNRSTFSGCYSEGGQGYTQGYATHTLFEGGFLIEAKVVGGASWVHAEFGKLKAPNGFLAAGTVKDASNIDVGIGVQIGGNAINRSIMQVTYNKDNSPTWYLKGDEKGGLAWSYLNGANQPFKIVGKNNTFSASPMLSISKRIEGVGGTEATVEAVTWTTANGTHTPTSGYFSKGSKIYTHRPIKDDYIGVICTVAGEAGSTAVFEKFGRVGEFTVPEPTTAA